MGYHIIFSAKCIKSEKLFKKRRETGRKKEKKTLSENGIEKGRK